MTSSPDPIRSALLGDRPTRPRGMGHALASSMATLPLDRIGALGQCIWRRASLSGLFDLTKLDRTAAGESRAASTIFAAGAPLLTYAFVFSIFVNLLHLVGPLFMMQVYDRVLSSRSLETLTALVLLIAMLYVIMGILDYARGRVLARFGARLQTALDEPVFAASLEGTDDPGARNRPSQEMRDVDAIQALFYSTGLLAMFDLPWVPLFLGLMFVFHPALGILGLVGGAIIVALAIVTRRINMTRTEKARTQQVNAHAFAGQARAGGDIVTSQGMRRGIASRWFDQRQVALEANLIASDWTGGLTAATKAFRLFLQSMVLAVGALLVLRGVMSPGAMIAGSILLGRALAPVEQSVGQWQVIERAWSAWRSLRQLLPDETVAPAAATELPRPEAHLSVKALTILPAGAEAPTLRNVSFTVEPGSVLGVIGRSGSGKSTLARSIVGIGTPRVGEIRLGGAALDQYDPDTLGRYVGYLPQDVALFPGTVAENIARMDSSPDSAAVVAAAKKANAHELILTLPQGYNTPLEGMVNRLSGGQRQRVGLARAFYGAPVMLVLDEPNSALDDQGAKALRQAIQSFAKSGGSVVIVTHRMNAIEYCDRLLTLADGQVQGIGATNDIVEAMRKKSAQVGGAPANAGADVAGTAAPASGSEKRGVGTRVRRDGGPRRLVAAGRPVTP